MGLLRTSLMELRDRQGGWESVPIDALELVGLASGGISETALLGCPLNLPEPLPRKAWDFAFPGAYIPA